MWIFIKTLIYSKSWIRNRWDVKRFEGIIKKNYKEIIKKSQQQQRNLSEALYHVKFSLSPASIRSDSWYLVIIHSHSKLRTNTPKRISQTPSALDIDVIEMIFSWNVIRQSFILRSNWKQQIAGNELRLAIFKQIIGILWRRTNKRD